MEIDEVSSVPVEELTTLLVGSLPPFDPGLIRTTFGAQESEHQRYLETRDVGGALAGIGFSVRALGFPAAWRLVYVATRRDLRRQRLGSRLWAQVQAGLDEGAGLLVTFVLDGDEAGTAVTAAWGFEVAQHSVTSVLDLTALAPVPAADGDGVTFHACDELSFDDEDAVEAMLLASQTNPEAEAGMRMTLASLQRPPPPGQRSLAVLARVDGRPAAISLGLAYGDDLHIHYTGVDPAVRGRALGRRTKEFLHAHAVGAGVTRAITDNEDGNTGIRHVNEQLGYVPWSGVSWMTRPRPAAS